MGRDGGATASRAPRRLAWLAAWACAAGLPPPARAQRAAVPSFAELDPIAEEVALARALAEIQRGPAPSRADGPAAEGSGAAYFRSLAGLAAQKARLALRSHEAAGHRPESPAALDAGVAKLAAGDVAAARSALGAYVERHPDDPFGHDFPGIVLDRQARSGEAAARFERAAAVAPAAPDRAGSGGLAGRDPGPSAIPAEDEPAADGARNLMATADGGGTLRGPAGAPDRPISPNGIVGPPASRRYNVALLNGYEYDTNVALAPGITPLGLGGLGNHKDSRWLAATFGEYRLLQRERLAVPGRAATRRADRRPAGRPRRRTAGESLQPVRPPARPGLLRGPRLRLVQ